jgi:hypothetical protein
MLRPELILEPTIALAALTYLVLLRLPYVRFRAIFAREVQLEDFRLFHAAQVPAELSVPNRNYMNLLELPTLFYAACLGLCVVGKVNDVDLVLAWSYVGVRAVHSLVHLTYNRVLHRFLLFATSNFVLAALWARLWLALH